VVAATVAALAAWAAVRAAGDPPTAPGQSPLADPGLPAAPRPSIEIGAPVRLAADHPTTRWARVRKPVAAKASPAAAARTLATLDVLTPEGTTQIVPVLGRTATADGRLWVRVGLPALPNGQRGWVPRSGLGGYGEVRTRVVVDVRRLSLTLYRGDRRLFRAPAGVGTPGAPPPRGRFIVRNRLTDFDDPFYGPVAFGTSARSAVLTDWPGGGFVGIHGTDDPAAIPGRVSHGCIRLRNPDIRRLDRLMPVGTPIAIR
jgi:lipoprotein-anchoring transpeptidase ErfK/SrfK